MVKLFTGWGVRGRPFTPSEFKKSHLYRKFVSKGGYSGYLKEFGRQYKAGIRIGYSK